MNDNPEQPTNPVLTPEQAAQIHAENRPHAIAPAKATPSVPAERPPDLMEQAGSGRPHGGHQ